MFPKIGSPGDLAHAASASVAPGADHAELAEEVLRYMLRGLVAWLPGNGRSGIGLAEFDASLGWGVLPKRPEIRLVNH